MPRSVLRCSRYALAVMLAASPAATCVLPALAQAADQPSSIADILDRTRSAAAEVAQAAGEPASDAPATRARVTRITNRRGFF